MKHRNYAFALRFGSQSALLIFLVLEFLCMMCQTDVFSHIMRNLALIKPNQRWSHEMHVNIRHLCRPLAIWSPATNANTKCEAGHMDVLKTPNHARWDLTHVSTVCFWLLLCCSVRPEGENNISGIQKRLLGLFQWLPGQNQRSKRRNPFCEINSRGKHLHFTLLTLTCIWAAVFCVTC